MSQVIIQPDESASDDTYIASNANTTNYGSSGILAFGNYGSGLNWRTLFKPSLALIPNGAKILSVTLYLYQNTSNHASGTGYIYRMIRSWGEMTATWNTYDGTHSWGTAGADNTSSDRESSAISTFSYTGSTTDGEQICAASIDPAKFQDWITGTIPYYGMLIRTSEAAYDLNTPYSSGATTASYRPKLVIEYTRPSGGVCSLSSGFGVM